MHKGIRMLLARRYKIFVQNFNYHLNTLPENMQAETVRKHECIEVPFWTFPLCLHFIAATMFAFQNDSTARFAEAFGSCQLQRMNAECRSIILTLRRQPRLAGDQHCDRTHRLA